MCSSVVHLETDNRFFSTFAEQSWVIHMYTYTHIHSINPVSASDLQLDIEHVNKLDNTEHV